jgi:hypothetical protein
MKTAKFLLILFIACGLSLSGLAYAELIITKDGQQIEAKISEKTDDTIWYEVASGDMTEYIGMEISNIEEILNDDRSLSEYSPNR